MMGDKVHTLTDAELEALLTEAHLRGSADAFASLRKVLPEFIAELERLAAAELER